MYPRSAHLRPNNKITDFARQHVLRGENAQDVLCVILNFLQRIEKALAVCTSVHGCTSRRAFIDKHCRHRGSSFANPGV